MRISYDWVRDDTLSHKTYYCNDNWPLSLISSITLTNLIQSIVV